MFARALGFLTLNAIVIVLLPGAGLVCRASSFHTLLINDTDWAQEDQKAARKFDEFGDLRECDLGARLDNFAIQLMSEPETQGHLIIYAGRYELPRRILSYQDRMIDYLVNTRGLSAGRLTAARGGHRERISVELWIVPRDAAAPEPSEIININKELDKAFKFDEQTLYLADDSEQFAVEEAPIEEIEPKAAVEEEAANEIVEAQAETADASSELEEAEEETAAAEEASIDYEVLWASEAYTRALRLEEKARALIIYYADREPLTLSRMQGIIERGKLQLIEKHGIKAERLSVIFGGYRQSPTVELWIVPLNVSLPIPTPEPEKKDDEQANQAAEKPAIPPLAIP